MMMFFWVIVLILVVIAVAYLLQSGGKGRDLFQSSSEQKSPLDILKERYAKGEISKEDFEKIKKDL